MTKIEAIATLNSKNCKGTITFIEKKKYVEIVIDLYNLKPGLHGFHIHEAGNLSDGCQSCCAHFNPSNKNHGGPNSNNRHVGDLGNIEANKNGICKTTFNDNLIKLRGYKYNIIGRSVVVHADEDDLGLGGNSESLKTGNAGKRIGCAVIGYKNGYYF